MNVPETCRALGFDISLDTEARVTLPTWTGGYLDEVWEGEGFFVERVSLDGELVEWVSCNCEGKTFHSDTLEGCLAELRECIEEEIRYWRRRFL